MSAPTPDDASVRGRYCDGVYVQTGHTTEGEDFDRWLTRHDAEVEARALRDAADSFGKEWAGRRDVQWLLRARADEIEGHAPPGFEGPCSAVKSGHHCKRFDPHGDSHVWVATATEEEDPEIMRAFNAQRLGTPKTTGEQK